MIAKLTGRVDSTTQNSAILDVQGVGYLVFCSGRTLDQLGAKGEVASLHIETNVREDHIHLYGFAQRAEQEWFNLLTTVQGVGAKVGLAMLSIMGPEELVQAIASGDKTALCRADGVGPKLANRLITELKDKVSNMSLGVSATQSGAANNAAAAAPALGGEKAVADAVSALINLGYGRAEAFGAVNKARGTEAGKEADLSSLITLGLRELSA